MGSPSLVSFFAVLGLVLGLVACGSTAPSRPVVWGSDQALLTVEDRSATLRIVDPGECYGSFGEIDQPIPTGTFVVPGSYTQLMGVFPGSVRYDAEFSGTVTGHQMILTVTIPSLQRTLGPFRLVYGVGEEWQACLFP